MESIHLIVSQGSIEFCDSVRLTVATVQKRFKCWHRRWPSFFFQVGSRPGRYVVTSVYRHVGSFTGNKCWFGTGRQWFMRTTNCTHLLTTQMISYGRNRWDIVMRKDRDVDASCINFCFC